MVDFSEKREVEMVIQRVTASSGGVLEKKAPETTSKAP